MQNSSGLFLCLSYFFNIGYVDMFLVQQYTVYYIFLQIFLIPSEVDWYSWSLIFMNHDDSYSWSLKTGVRKVFNWLNWLEFQPNWLNKKYDKVFTEHYATTGINNIQLPEHLHWAFKTDYDLFCTYMVWKFIDSCHPYDIYNHYEPTHFWMHELYLVKLSEIYLYTFFKDSVQIPIPFLFKNANI